MSENEEGMREKKKEDIKSFVFKNSSKIHSVEESGFLDNHQKLGSLTFY
jgi:hypothetical protein